MLPKNKAPGCTNPTPHSRMAEENPQTPHRPPLPFPLPLLRFVNSQGTPTPHITVNQSCHFMIVYSAGHQNAHRQDTKCKTRLQRRLRELIGVQSKQYASSGHVPAYPHHGLLLTRVLSYFKTFFYFKSFSKNKLP